MATAAELLKIREKMGNFECRYRVVCTPDSFFKDSSSDLGQETAYPDMEFCGISQSFQ